jgi:hypothetical protein
MCFLASGLVQIQTNGAGQTLRTEVSAIAVQGLFGGHITSLRCGLPIFALSSQANNRGTHIAKRTGAASASKPRLGCRPVLRLLFRLVFGKPLPGAGEPAGG